MSIRRIAIPSPNKDSVVSALQRTVEAVNMLQGVNGPAGERAVRVSELQSIGLVELQPSGELGLGAAVGLGTGGGTTPGSGLPSGGATGQALLKASDADGDAVWASLGIPSIAGLQAALDAGTAALAAHVAAADPHPQYLTSSDIAGLFAPLVHGHAISDVALLGDALNARVAKAGDTMSGDLQFDLGVAARWVVAPPTGLSPAQVIRAEVSVDGLAITASSTDTQLLTLSPTTGAVFDPSLPLRVGFDDVWHEGNFDPSAYLLQSTAAATYVPLSQRGAALGVATLDGGGKVPVSQLPATVIVDTFVVASQAAMLALGAQQGDVAIRTDINKSFILRAEPATTLGNWQEILAPLAAVSSVFGRTGAVTAEAGDYSAFYLPRTGGTVTGDVTFDTSAALVFDDENIRMLVMQGLSRIFLVGTSGNSFQIGQFGSPFDLIDFDLNPTSLDVWRPTLRIDGNAAWHAGNLLNIGTTAASARAALGLGTMALEPIGNFVDVGNPQTVGGIKTFTAAANFDGIINRRVTGGGWMVQNLPAGGGTSRGGLWSDDDAQRITNASFGAQVTVRTDNTIFIGALSGITFVGGANFNNPIWKGPSPSPAGELDISTGVGRFLVRNNGGFMSLDSVNEANSAYIQMQYLASEHRFEGGAIRSSGILVPLNGMDLYNGAVLRGRVRTQHLDSRGSSPAPKTFGGSWTVDFKDFTDISLTAGATYFGVQTISPWVDDSGGGDHQMAYGDNGRIYHRYGTAAGGWQSWAELVRTSGATFTAPVISNPSGVTPAAPATFAFTAQGAFGGGYRMIDGSVQTGIWTQSDGTIRFGVGTSAGLNYVGRIDATGVYDVVGNVRDIVTVQRNSSTAIQASDRGKLIYKDNTTAYSWTLSAGGENGWVITAANYGTAGNLTIVRSGLSLTNESNVNADLVLTPGQTRSLLCISPTVWRVL